MNIDELFENYGFLGEERSKCENFYRPFFKNSKELDNFFIKVFESGQIPRCLMYDIMWFVSLADDIEIIRPKKDPLRIMFYRICLETLNKDSGSDKKDFLDHFDSFFSETGKKYIEANYNFLEIDIPEELEGLDRINFDTHSNYKMTCSDFLKMIRATRNCVVHEGDFWSTQFFAYDTDSIWLTKLITDDEVLSCQPRKKNKYLVYNFSTTMQYDKFRYFFVEACLNYIEDKINAK